MAAAQTRSEQSGIFWVNDTASEEQPIFIPGVSRDIKFPFSVRAGPRSSCEKGTKMRNKRDCEKSIKPPLSKVEKQQIHMQSGASLVYNKEKESDHISAAVAMAQKISETNTTKAKTNLKDLCPEDKRRIANLIEELARVSEEKEESVQRLRDEQETFERKIQQLEQQNLLIVQERGSLQQQYKECQELLGLYQQYLSQQQEKLNQSIAQLHSKVCAGHADPDRPSTSRTNGSALDGSFLGPDSVPAGRRGDGGRAAAEACSRHSAFSDASPPDSAAGDRERAAAAARGPVDGCTETTSVPRHGCDCSSGYSCRAKTGSASKDPCLPNGSQSWREQQECNRLPGHAEAAGLPGARGALTAPLLGHEDWEEKRHQLLLQKMELESERGRLQARLAEQEERLLRQGQQLRQSRLDYSRFKHAARAQLASSITGNGASQSERPPNQRLFFSVCEDADAVEQVLSEETPQSSAGALQRETSARESLQRSRHDMATSPVTDVARHRHPTPVCTKAPEARLDTSLLDLLEVFSPVPVPSHCKPHVHTHKIPPTVPQQPATFVQNPQQDLEESQILEDIFFIC